MNKKSGNITLTMTELTNVASVIAEARFPLLIRGRHGIGKSEFVYNGLAKKLGYPVIEMRASQMTEGDLIGLPFKGDLMEVRGKSIGTTEWLPPNWFLSACAEPVVLFFDEVDRATTEVRQGLFQLNDSRALNGHSLHPDTVVVACINGGQHASAYQVNEMDPAEIDRYTVFDLEPTEEEWINWASSQNIFPEVVAFIRENPKYLENKAVTFDPTVIHPSRRSWTRYAKALEQMLPTGAESDQDLAMAMVVGTGFVGQDAASAFKGFMSNYQREINPHTIFVKGDFSRTRDWTAPDWISLLEKADSQGYFSVEAFAGLDLDNVARVITSSPVETFPIVIKMLSKVDPKFAMSFITGKYDHPSNEKMAEWCLKNFISSNDKMFETLTGKTVEDAE